MLGFTVHFVASFLNCSLSFSMAFALSSSSLGRGGGVTAARGGGFGGAGGSGGSGITRIAWIVWLETVHR
jgi:hypothetical protein